MSGAWVDRHDTMTRNLWFFVTCCVFSAACFEPRYQESIVCSERDTCSGGMLCDPLDNRCRYEMLDFACDDGARNGDETDMSIARRPHAETVRSI
jgi:hypothetical protein